MREGMAGIENPNIEGYNRHEGRKQNGPWASDIPWGNPEEIATSAPGELIMNTKSVGKWSGLQSLQNPANFIGDFNVGNFNLVRRPKLTPAPYLSFHVRAEELNGDGRPLFKMLRAISY